MERLKHTVKSYDEELQRLSSIILEMGGMAESQIDAALQAMIERDGELAARTIEADKRIDHLEKQINEFAIRLLALRQPMATDLREIVAALKIAADIERIGDYAKNLAKRSLAMNQAAPVRPMYQVPRMAKLVQKMIKDTLDAYVTRDAEAALAVRSADEEVDETYNSLFRELLTYMMEDPRSITACTHLLFIAKNIERMGDLATNIAETIHFLVYGDEPEEERPKQDQTPYTRPDEIAPGGGSGGGEPR